MPAAIARAYNLRRHVASGVCASHALPSCIICKKVFPSVTELQEHASSCTPPKHTCADCGKEFGRKDNFERHRKSKACQRKRTTLYRRAQCDVCKRKFRTGYTLERHIRNGACGFKRVPPTHHRGKICHQPLASFYCPSCPDLFTSQFLLDVHTLSHTLTHESYSRQTATI